MVSLHGRIKSAMIPIITRNHTYIYTYTYLYTYTHTHTYTYTHIYTHIYIHAHIHIHIHNKAMTSLHRRIKSAMVPNISSKNMEDMGFGSFDEHFVNVMKETRDKYNRENPEVHPNVLGNMNTLLQMLPSAAKKKMGLDKV